MTTENLMPHSVSDLESETEAAEQLRKAAQDMAKITHDLAETVRQLSLGQESLFANIKAPQGPNFMEGAWRQQSDVEESIAEENLVIDERLKSIIESLAEAQRGFLSTSLKQIEITNHSIRELFKQHLSDNAPKKLSLLAAREHKSSIAEERVLLEDAKALARRAEQAFSEANINYRRMIQGGRTLSDRVLGLDASIDTLTNEINTLKFLSQQQYDGKQSRIFPVSIYLSENAGVDTIEAIVEKIILLMKAEVVYSSKPVLASYFRRLWAKFNTPKSKQDLLEITETVKKATEIQTVSIPKSQEVVNYAKALSEMRELFKDSESAAILIPPLFAVKHSVNGEPHFVSKVLSNQELEYLARNQEVLNDPDRAWAALDELNESSAEDRLKLTNKAL